MSSSVVRATVAAVLVLHGLGHVLGVLPLFGLRLSAQHSANAWLLPMLSGTLLLRGLAVFLWLGALVAFVGGGLGLLGWVVPGSRWEVLAVAGSWLSLAAMLVFWGGLPFLFPNRIGAIIVNVWVLAMILWIRKPTAIFS